VSVNIIRFLTCLFFLLFSAGYAQEEKGIDWEAVKGFFRSHSAETLVYADKSQFRIFVISRQKKILFEAPIAIGQNPDLLPKLHQDDKRTPEGLYKVIEVMHQDMPPESPGYRKIQKMNSVFFSKSEGYHKWGKPNQDLGTNSFGYGFFRLNYPNALDKRRYIQALQKGLVPKNSKGEFRPLGGGIGIHGTNDPDSLGHPASTGCIRVRNEELKILSEHLKLGQYVLISR
jgi:murein L,D-transpeptidase YafK